MTRHLPSSHARPELPDTGRDLFDQPLRRWHALLVTPGAVPDTPPFRSALDALGDRAAQLLRTLDPEHQVLFWSDLSPHVSGDVLEGCRRLLTMAQALRQPGIRMDDPEPYEQAITAGILRLRAEGYRETPPRTSNWWHLQVGIPRTLLDLYVLMRPRLTTEQLDSCLAVVDAHVPRSSVADYTGTSTGANRVDLCRVLALRGMLGRDAGLVATARDALSPVYRHVLAGDGLYADGSFIQHTWVPYTGSYGAGLLGGISRLLWLLGGSPWEVTDPELPNVFGSVTRGYAPFLYNGLMMDAVSGRGIARGPRPGGGPQPDSGDHARGHTVVAEILRLADCGAAPADEASAWRALAKGWIERDTVLPYLTDPALSLPDLLRAHELLLDTTVEVAPEPVGHRLFPAMDRAVHRRPGWAAAVSMSSARTTYYECGGGENPRGWHTGSGMLYVWGDTWGNDQYCDGFWPTVDPYRLPGTTVSRRPLADGEGGLWGASRPATLWAGGVTDGRYAALGQDVRGLSSYLAGRKSWFCLDELVVCLGAGIYCSDGAPVETIVDNRNLGADGLHTLWVDGQAQPGGLDWTDDFPAATSAAIEGFGGFAFPGGATVRAQRSVRTGSWRDISVHGSADPISRRYLTLWFDHGTDPTGAHYSYLLLPGADAEAAAAAARDPAVTVLANTAAVQAVSHGPSGVTAANFFGGATAGPITADAPCSVLLRRDGDRLRVHVADPTTASATVTVSLASAGELLGHDPRMEVLGTDPITLAVHTGGTSGAGHSALFRV